VNLPRWSLRYPVTASVLIISILAVGALTAPKIPLAFLPDEDFPNLNIEIPYPNALPAQVEEEIARPAEEALATMSRVRRIQSWSTSSGANISVEFDWGEDIGPLRVDAREKLDRIRDLLPPDVDLIRVNGFRSSDIPVLECRVAADRDLSRSYELLNRHVADPLRRVPGVAKVELYGVEPPQVLVEFSLDGLERHGLSAEAVLSRVEASSRSLSAGRLRRGEESWPLRVVNEFATLEDIGSLPVDDHGLTLRDIAAITYREPDLDYGRHLDRARAVGFNVMKESGANTVDVATRARRQLDEIARNPQMRGIQVLTFTDQGEQVTNSIEGLLEAGLIGAVLAVIVLFFFLRNIVTTLVVATAIPFSLLAAAALMYFTGRTLNILSMMGLMLAVGMLVDNAVVVLEAIYRRRQEGMSALHAALTGAREVLPAVVCSTLCSIIVFLPLVLGGRTEITTWLAEVGRTIIFTLVCSLYLSLTAIPLAVGRFLPPTRPSSTPKSLGFLTDRYVRTLAWTLRHRVLSASLALVFFLVSVGVFIPVNKSFISGSKVEAIFLEYEFADNLNYREVEKYVTRVENAIAARQDSLHIKSTYSYFTHNFAFTRAYLADGYANNEGSEVVRRLVRKGLPDLPGVKIEVRGQDDDDSGGSSVTVNVFGDPGPRLDQLAAEVRRRMVLIPGTEAVEIGGEKGSKEIEVLVDRDRASRYGLTASDVAGTVALFFRGRPLSRFRGPDGEVQVQARLADADRNSLERLRGMPIAVDAATAEGPTVPLGAVASFRTVQTAQGIERQQRRSVVSVRADVDSKKRNDVRKAISEDLKSLHFPAGYAWSYGSAFQEENETQMEMLLNLVLALMLVYIVMAALFESFLHPFAIMFALPYGFAGVAWMCFLTGTPFNLMAMIGMLILVGIVVNNGIVLLHHVHQLREGGLPRPEALMKAGRDRLRPILMTTATTVLGLMPLALGGTHVGDILYYPLARTVMGGLVVSTVITLVLVPVLYTLLEDGWNGLARAWRGRPASARLPAAPAAGATALALMALVGAAAPPPVAADPFHKEFTRHWSLAGAQKVDLHVGVGEVEVRGEDRQDVHVTVRVSEDGDDPESFERWARRFDVVAHRPGNRLRVEVRGPKFTFRERGDVEVLVRVPRHLALDVDMAIGSLSVSNVRQRLDLRLGVGEVDVRLPQAGVRDVKVDLGIGEASLEAGGRRRIESASVFGSGLKWSEGRGTAPVSVRLGVGEVAVLLD
jgi:HAE1 family hydrophobic/amphiphilic exporter-1